MTRTEHRDANHLEDDGGIREIIQNAQIMPISDAEKSGHGQMARLQEPQQLWDRKGWSQFSSLSRKANGDSNPKKRKATYVSFDGVTDAEESVEPPEKVAKRTLAFVDCRSSEPPDRQSYENLQDGDNDDEPIIRRFRPAPAKTPSKPPAYQSLQVRSEDPYIPLTGHLSAEDSHNSESSTRVVASFSDRHQDQSAVAQDFRRVSISQLLNDDGHSEPGPGSDQAWLLKEILRRL
jgi:hypothetical protein